MRVLIGLIVMLGNLAAANSSPILIAKPGKSPLITIRVVFRTGAAIDPPGKEGLASMVAAMLAEGGSRTRTYKQILDALFPMAAQVQWQVDKEMTSFTAETHLDNLTPFYAVLREMLLDPGWREDDIKRLKDDSVNFLRVSLRGNNDEELGKETLYQEIYSGHPYAHHSVGRAQAIGRLTAADLKAFYRQHYTQSNLTIAIAGAYPKGFPSRMRRDFAKLAKGPADVVKLPTPRVIEGRHLTLVQKETDSVAISIGFPIAVRRGHPDFVALMLAASWLGQHRNSGVRLYDRLRELRGLNYGDYAYVEYFPRGMFLFEPDPNLARQQQIFQVWIRPVVPDTAHFALRLAMFELERFHREGLSEEEFERTRNFLNKYVNLLTKTKKGELGYDIDSRFYGIADFNSYVKSGLAKLTRAEVNRAIRQHLPMDNLQIVMVSANAEDLRKRIVEERPSPMKYNSPKSGEILDEDKIVEVLRLKISSGNAKIVKASDLFE